METVDRLNYHKYHKSNQQEVNDALNKIAVVYSRFRNIPTSGGNDIFQAGKVNAAKIQPIAGMTISFTREVTIAVKALPMITPTARSMTLPREINFLNSAIKPFAFSFHTSLLIFRFVHALYKRLSALKSRSPPTEWERVHFPPLLICLLNPVNKADAAHKELKRPF